MNQDNALSDPPNPLRPGLRQAWMLKENLTFLNHGSFGAVPREVFEVQNQWRERIEADPIEILGRRSAELIEAAKAPVGEAFGMKAENFGFITNATEGINAVLRDFPLRPGDELLTTDHVYNAVRQAMRHIARRCGAGVREIPIPLPVRSGHDIADIILGAISPATRLIVLDHVTSPTALVFPIERIIEGCRSRGIKTLIDGAHAPGMIPLDIERLGATYYAANLHKWVCAPKGAAFLWVDPSVRPSVHPAVVSHFLDEGLVREFGWQGTRDISAWLAVPAAIEFMRKLDWNQVMEHNHQLAVWAHRMLVRQFDVEPVCPLDGSLLGATATVRLPGRLSELEGKPFDAFHQQMHDEFAVEVPLMRFGGRTHLRVSCPAYAVAADFHRLADVIVRLSTENDRGL